MSAVEDAAATVKDDADIAAALVKSEAIMAAVAVKNDAVTALLRRERQTSVVLMILVGLGVVLAIFAAYRQVQTSNQISDLSAALRHATDQQKQLRTARDQARDDAALASAQREELVQAVEENSATLTTLQRQNQALQSAIQDLLVARTPAERRAAVARLRASGGSSSTQTKTPSQTTTTAQGSGAGPQSGPSGAPPSSTTTTPAPCKVPVTTPQGCPGG